jgi:PIN domain nuclease of toxin-antitoxin system
MRVLLDTHILLWALIEPSKLNLQARATLENPGNEILFSAASIWEIAIKFALGRADFGVSPERIVDAARESGFVELAVRSTAALRVAALPPHHRDPFDRLLVAQAIIEPAILYTADDQLTVYSDLVVQV